MQQHPRIPKFQSTLPLRGATAVRILWVRAEGISIHAPLTGSDDLPRRFQISMLDFNPRSPYGERLKSAILDCPIPTFQSTLPLRGATGRSIRISDCPSISIHAPLTGSDLFRSLSTMPPSDFNPRSPYGERRVGTEQRSCRTSNFNPRSPYGERPASFARILLPHDFNPRSPYGERLAWPVNVGSKS